MLALIARDDVIAGILNRNGLKTGNGNRWTRERVTSLRSSYRIRSIPRGGGWGRAVAQPWRGRRDRRCCAAHAATGRGTRRDRRHAFGREADDPVVEKLCSAALGIGLATGHAELREAAEKLAEVMQTIGLDRWPRFLADAQERARDPATVAAIQKSQSPPGLRKDAIRPVYPIETLFGIGAVGVAGGTAAATRAVGPQCSATGTRPRVRTASPSEFRRIENGMMEGAKRTSKPDYRGTWYIPQLY